MTKQELIEHCKKTCKNNSFPITTRQRKLYWEHRIFCELLQGRDVNEMFDENGEYNERTN